ncbi:UDP-glucose 4-epimerase [Thalassobacillus devorans]|uniref:UDP-glucose 4-epimerase n=1 Tax=Thalassobacillus devorans TaxID=279813 RepID=A0ABQ1P2D1_9BACI|nr:NAD-dependent epimerase/dehydratase family protein [Thalassobacillus devorans]NIK28049.1 nucleoside-diphosphate-sugar epimerase [Thalassobacillus devorans]GGC89283.1 UDP-glucose 4-epimerase [Thalassobacillus devorans]
MGKILVTGGFGFLGGHLVKRLLTYGEEVVVFDTNFPSNGSPIKWLLSDEIENIEYVIGDITDKTIVMETVNTKNIKKIFHAAVINDLDILANDPLLTMKVNVEGTLNILEAARNFNVEKVVLASSVSVYTPVKYEPIDEYHPVISPDEGPTLLSYSSSKISAESFAQHYWLHYGLDIISLRFSGIYGFGMKYPMYIKPMVENAVEQKPTFFKDNGSSKRDYTHINDVTKGIILALDKPLKKNIFNISSGEKLISPREIAKIVEDLTPNTTVKFGNERNIIEDRSAKTRGILSIKSAKSDLGFNPGYNLKDGIREYFNLYKSYLVNNDLYFPSKYN